MSDRHEALAVSVLLLIVLCACRGLSGDDDRPSGNQAAPPIQATPQAQRLTVQPPPAMARAIARAEPNFGAAEVMRVPAGTEVDALGTSADTLWYQIRYAGQVGWIHRDVVRPAGTPRGPRTYIHRCPAGETPRTVRSGCMCNDGRIVNLCTAPGGSPAVRIENNACVFDCD